MLRCGPSQRHGAVSSLNYRENVTVEHVRSVLEGAAASFLPGVRAFLRRFPGAAGLASFPSGSPVLAGRTPVPDGPLVAPPPACLGQLGAPPLPVPPSHETQRPGPER